MKEKTVKTPFSFKGIGIHTGETSSVYIRPAESGGIVFLKNGKKIPASVENVVSSIHGTDIGDGESVIRTVEHLMSAIHGLGIDHLEIEVDGDEIPILDGSSKPFVEMFLKAGIRTLESNKNFFRVEKPVSVSTGEGFARAIPFRGLSITYVVSYQHPCLQFLHHTLESIEDYLEEIAPARTFGVKSWADSLRKNGLIKGASIDNLLLFDDNGPVNNPRFINEVVRHKILDFIGDIGLLSRNLEGYFVIIKGGHTLHFELARKLKQGGVYGV